MSAEILLYTTRNGAWQARVSGTTRPVQCQTTQAYKSDTTLPEPHPDDLTLGGSARGAVLCEAEVILKTWKLLASDFDKAVETCLPYLHGENPGLLKRVAEAEFSNASLNAEIELACWHRFVPGALFCHLLLMIPFDRRARRAKL